MELGRTQRLQKLEQDEQERRAREERARERDSRQYRRYTEDGPDSMISADGDDTEATASPAAIPHVPVLAPSAPMDTRPARVRAPPAAGPPPGTVRRDRPSSVLRRPPTGPAVVGGNRKRKRGPASQPPVPRTGAPSAAPAIASSGPGGSNETVDVDTWQFSCVCGVRGTNYDDGTPMIACDQCGTWQHLQCYPLRPESVDRLEFLCRACVDQGRGAADGDYQFRCVCGAAGTNYDDGREMVQCEGCDTWAHTACQAELRHVRLADVHYYCRDCRARSSAPSGSGSAQGAGDDVDVEETSPAGYGSPTGGSGSGSSSSSSSLHSDDGDVVVDDDETASSDSSASDDGDGEQREPSSPAVSKVPVSVAPGPRMGFACRCGIVAKAYDDGSPTLVCEQCGARLHLQCAGSPPTPLCALCHPGDD
jgi:hypothetical protein